MQAAIEIKDLSFRWQSDAEPILSIAELSLAQGQKLFVEGPSGSGKSTLLSLLAGIQPMQQGSLQMLGTDMQSLSAHQRDVFRSRHIGYVFQQFNLLPYLSVLDNVLLAQTFRGSNLSKAESVVRATELLSTLHIPLPLQRQSAQHLSVGQQQRVAIARALFNKPDIIIADEPTSALDHANAAAFMQLLLRQIDEIGSTLVYVSHDESLRLNFDKVLKLKSHGALL